MNTKLILLMLIFAAGAIVFAACGTAPTTTNSNTAAGQTNAMPHGNMMNGNMTMNHNGMPMNDDQNMSPMMPGGGMMGQSDPNAATAPYDLQFLDSMTHHHEGAIRMSQMVLSRSQNEEMKKFAQKIIADQQREIDQIKKWREEWYSGKPRAVNMEMPGMMSSTRGMMQGGGMGKMMSLQGKEFDLAFLQMMIPHHQGAVDISKEAQSKAEHAELKPFAGQIIKEQEAEIKQMNEWKEAWSK
jgi:uncharacterized protein (DUF305 family)